MEEAKFKVIVILETFTIEEPILHYIKIGTDIKNVLIQYYLRDFNVTYDTIKEHFEAEILNSELYTNEEIEEAINNKVGSTEFWLKNHMEHWLKVGCCGEGSFTYEIIEMTQSEFENPIGELMSPYASECLNEGEEPVRSKYKFYHPITNTITYLVK